MYIEIYLPNIYRRNEYLPAPLFLWSNSNCQNSWNTSELKKWIHRSAAEPNKSNQKSPTPKVSQQKPCRNLRRNPAETPAETFPETNRRNNKLRQISIYTQLSWSQVSRSSLVSRRLSEMAPQMFFLIRSQVSRSREDYQNSLPRFSYSFGLRSRGLANAIKLSIPLIIT